ncbi:citrate/2-methylcitrate synthase [Streptomyces canus]|uniref:citrate/2-methylcitrate synthase n=1 Tax=Streptomyces canus TaxID=58343 RepID=UPI0036BFC710
MATFTTDHWDTHVAEVRHDDVLVRGVPLTGLMSEAGLADVAYLVLTGRRASQGQARVLEALMVSTIEHGISPSSTVARMMASYGVPIQVGIAAGQLTVGDYHGGAGEQIAGRFRDLLDTMGPADSAASIRELAETFVAKSRAARTPIEGFGHPQHGADPRTPVLLDLARTHGVYGDACLLMEEVEAALEAHVGRRIPANIDGVCAALLLDLGIDPRAARPVLMASRVIGLAAHFLEEVDQGSKWRHVPAEKVVYTPGPQQ